MAFDKNQDHSIDLNDAAKMTEKYRKSMHSPSDPIAAAFNAQAFTDVLNQSGCEGIRMYYALDDNDKLTLVFVGMDSNGDDMYEDKIMEWAGACPPFCGAANPLNS